MLTAAQLPNQPMAAHPRPYGLGKAIGASSTIVTGIAAGSDTLLIGPPVAGEARDISPFESVLLINHTTSALAYNPDDFQLIYKDGNGNECIVDSNPDAGILAVGSAGQTATLVLGFHKAFAFLLAPTDLGIFLRRNDAVAVSIDAHARYFDVRDMDRVSQDMTSVSAVILTGGPGRVLFLGKLFEAGTGYMAVANFDSVQHRVSVLLSNGTDTINITETDDTDGLVVPVPAGTMLPLPIASSAAPFLLNGWTLSLSIEADVTDAPCRAIIGVQATNLAPVKQYQGGAY